MTTTVPPIAEPVSIVDKIAADRVAAALTAAAAAEERIAALTEALSRSEYLRSRAEREVYSLTAESEMPTIYSSVNPPPETVFALVDVVTGAAFCRSAYGANTWRRLGKGFERLLDEWPVDSEGPFIAMPDGSEFDTYARSLDKVMADRLALSRLAQNLDVRPHPWDHDLLEVFGSVLNRANQDAADATDRLARLRAALAHVVYCMDSGQPAEDTIRTIRPSIDEMMEIAQAPKEKK